jgi:hypothetical protein
MPFYVLRQLLGGIVIPREGGESLFGNKGLIYYDFSKIEKKVYFFFDYC